MQAYPVVCEIRYSLDNGRLEEFEAYARIWVALIRRHGGVHYGFFMPRTAPADTPMSFAGKGAPGAMDEAIALFGFASEDTYRNYRKAVAADPDGIAANARFADPPFKSYERLFLRPVSERAIEEG